MVNMNQNILFISTILALCILSFMHIFLFPLYDFNAKQTFLKTFSDFEQEICSKHIKYTVKKPMKRYRRCPQYGIVTVYPGGRLGNNMWEYANVWAVARRTGLDPYVPQCILRNLGIVFESLSVPSFEKIGHCSFNLNKFVKSLKVWNYTNQSIIMPQYEIKAQVVLTWVQDIIQEFTFKKKLLRKSQQILLRITQGVPNITFVGIHVRRTDYIDYLLRNYGIQPAHVEFYINSMEYYRNKYKNVRFVVVSDDPEWCRENFANVDYVHILGSNPSALDLAVLASCNHTIFDYGTYGTWGAILAGGESIYFNVSHHASLRVGELLPNWHVMN